MEKPAGSPRWTPETIAMADALSIQLGAALESARLYQDISLRANTELAISEISSKIGSSVNLRNILRTTVQELGRVLPETEIIIQLQSDQGMESH
jgi:GAF domain-containing protein